MEQVHPPGHRASLPASLALPEDVPPRLLRRREVMSRIGVSNTKLYAMIGKGEFPRPIQLSPGLVAWEEAEVNNWIRGRIAESKARAITEQQRDDVAKAHASQNEAQRIASSAAGARRVRAKTTRRAK